MNNLNGNKLMGNIVETNNGEVKNKINKSNQNNINKTKTIIQKPNVSELQYKEPETYRPHLKDREGDIVTGFGYIVGRSNIPGSWIVINLVDKDDCYICDHVHMDMKESIYGYSVEDTDSIFIKFTGRVEEYTRSNGTKDYKINITKPIKFINDYFYNVPENVCSNYDKEKITKFFENASRRELIDLLIKLKEELGELTSYEFGENFIYSYIINTFMLNRASYDLYEGNLRGLVISNYGLVDMIYIITNTIFQIRHSTKLTLIEIIHLITVNCNVLQHVSNYDKGNDKAFKKYCQVHLKIKDLNSAWNTMLCRRKNFGKNPNPYNISLIDILDISFTVLDKYIR